MRRFILVNLAVICYLTCVLGYSLRNGVDIQGKHHEKLHAAKTLKTVKRNSIDLDVTNGTESLPNYIAYSLRQPTLNKKYHGIQKCPPGTFECSNGRCIALTSLCDGIDDCHDGSDEASCRSRRSINKCGPNNCTADRFQCTNGQWINRNWMCDGDRDCRDGSDELDCLNRECLPPRFKCRNTGRCIQSHWRCDGDDDCHDGSDEAGCSAGDCSPNICTGNRFQCTSGQLINRNWMCDGDRDCGDGSDELNCLHRTCSSSRFKCANTGRCVPMTWHCDGADDCHDGSDEAGCSTSTNTSTSRECGSNACTADRFQCTNGRWISRNWMCDGDRDCADGSDEQDCANRICAQRRFKCVNTGRCVPISWHCDGADDCHDGSDEAGCSSHGGSTTSTYPECGTNTCTADRFQCNNGNWINRNYICDDDRDCSDGSDEQDCAHRPCPSSKFKCATGRCVPSSWRCDGTDDCHDGSDEAGCTTPHSSGECGSNACDQNRFQCTNGRWINRNWMCDGDRDCTDGSDEHDCMHRNCSSSRFKCANNGRCIPMSWHCDGADDCHDGGSDEVGCTPQSVSTTSQSGECGSNACTADLFECTNGRWINRNWVCDGDRDCTDGSDEYDCVHRACSSSRFKCANTGRCVPLSWHCDGADDCHDGSDEVGCSAHTSPSTTPPGVYLADCGSNNCTVDRFQCNNGNWINRNYICDGDRDCTDGSDEQDCAHRNCSSSRFKCANTGRCVPLSWHCDGDDDCHDGSDEAGCSAHTSPAPSGVYLTDCGFNNCTADRFQCNNGNWINRNYICDGDRDCTDGSDEQDCAHRNCSMSRFKCANTGRCVSMSWRCDGDDDCHDGSDEADCPSHLFTDCGSSNCTYSHFQCNSGQWVPRRYVCDGDRDCHDGSDEHDCLHRNCSSLKFKCANTGRCVPLSWHCDGADDCHDGSDEAGCPRNTSETSSEFSGTVPVSTPPTPIDCSSNSSNCSRFRCNNGQWINKNYVCDGDRDCTDGSDENGCLERACPPTRFKCANTGRCISLSWHCDGADDCHDESDEIGCPSHLLMDCGSNNCTVTQYQCNNGQWIKRNYVCDGDRDCSDGSDENDCLNRSCSSRKFKCANTGRCVPLGWFCDGADDCHDGSDEVGCSGTTSETMTDDLIPDSTTPTPIDCGPDSGNCSRFHCNNGQWINKNFVCDGDRDCTDGSDEDDCLNRNCSSSRFKCANTGRCVPSSWRCDGADDCHDESDEIGCPSHLYSGCGSNNCTTSRFQCNNGQWITRNYVCDGDRDCSDGSDEYDCLHRNCSSRKFKCANTGRCVPRLWRCDGADDCHDGSDEAGCHSITAESTTEYAEPETTPEPAETTTEYVETTTEYIETTTEYIETTTEYIETTTKYIETTTEYIETTTEYIETTTVNECISSDFRCSNGQCVNQKLLCDGENDCADGSDEAGCEMSSTISSTTQSEEKDTTATDSTVTGFDLCTVDPHFQCHNGQCVNDTFVCDGEKDCVDGSDEESCENFICPSTRFHCPKDQKCVPMEWRCDGLADCSDSWDELSCPPRDPLDHNTLVQSRQTVILV